MKKYAGRLYCFSPPVMLATFVLEVVLAAIAIWKYKLTPITRLVATILLFLAGFQLAEFMVCSGGLGMNVMTWSRLGYIDITILPILGLHLAMVVAKKRLPPLLFIGYGSAFVFMIFFMFVEQAITGQQCLGNYVIFSTAPGSETLYTIYYYGWIFAVIYMAFRWAQDAPKKIKTALYALAIGYLVFLLPTTTVNIVSPSTISGIPSIMCGFAVLFALVIFGWVLPLSKRN